MTIFGELQYFLENEEAKNIFIELLDDFLDLKCEDINFNGLEEFKSIAEYDFYLINFIVKTQNNLKKEIFVKRIKKGKIKESLFCICDLAYNKYFNTNSKEAGMNPRKIAVLEEKEKVNNINRVSVNLFKENQNEDRVNIQINFIEMFDVIERIKNKIEGWEGNVEINQNDIIIIGVKNNY